MNIGILEFKRETAQAVINQDASLLSFYKFENNGNDETGYKNIGIYTDPSYGTGKVGKSLYLPGGGVYKSASGSNYSMNINNGFSFWFKTANSTNASGQILDVISASPIFTLYIEYSGASSGLVFTTVNNIIDTSVLSSNVWHHVVHTTDYYGVPKVYIDNIETGSFTGTTGVPGYTKANTSITIGKTVGEPFQYSAKFDIDQFRVYNGYLTASDVSTLWNGGSGI